MRMKYIKKYKEFESFSDLSKHVGWERSDVNYPTMEEVLELEKKLKKGDKSVSFDILKFHRFLPSPQNEKEIEIINKIYELFIEISRNNESMLSSSKEFLGRMFGKEIEEVDPIQDKIDILESDLDQIEDGITVTGDEHQIIIDVDGGTITFDLDSNKVTEDGRTAGGCIDIINYVKNFILKYFRINTNKWIISNKYNYYKT